MQIRLDNIFVKVFFYKLHNQLSYYKQTIPWCLANTVAICKANIIYFFLDTEVCCQTYLLMILLMI